MSHAGAAWHVMEAVHDSTHLRRSELQRHGGACVGSLTTGKESLMSHPVDPPGCVAQEL